MISVAFAGTLLLIWLGAIAIGGRSIVGVGMWPFFLGELVLALAVVLARPDWRWTALPLMGRWLAVWLMCCALRLVVSLPVYGPVALQDAVIWIYAAWAWLTWWCLCRLDGDQVQSAITRWLWPLVIVVPLCWAWFGWAPEGRLAFPPLFPDLKPGDVMVWTVLLLGAAVVCCRHRAWSAIVVGALLVVPVVLVGPLNRAGQLAYGLGLIVLLLSQPRSRVIWSHGAVLALVILLGAMFQWGWHYAARDADYEQSLNREVSWRGTLAMWGLSETSTVAAPAAEPTADPGEQSSVETQPSVPGDSPEAITTDVAQGTEETSASSALAVSPPLDPPVGDVAPEDAHRQSQLASIATDNAVWRVRWWREVIVDSVSSPSVFLFGHGFGFNCTTHEGFVGKESQLRHPHNAFVGFVARTGWPLTLAWIVWLGFLAWMLVRRWRQPLAVFALSGLGASTINASLDVYWENPMGGIPFWVLVGMAIYVVSQPRITSQIKTQQGAR